MKKSWQNNGLVSNARARYKSVQVMTTETDKATFEKKKTWYEKESLKLQAANPEVVHHAWLSDSHSRF